MTKIWKFWLKFLENKSKNFPKIFLRKIIKFLEISYLSDHFWENIKNRPPVKHFFFVRDLMVWISLPHLLALTESYYHFLLQLKGPAVHVDLLTERMLGSMRTPTGQKAAIKEELKRQIAIAVSHILHSPSLQFLKGNTRITITIRGQWNKIWRLGHGKNKNKNKKQKQTKKKKKKKKKENHVLRADRPRRWGRSVVFVLLRFFFSIKSRLCVHIKVHNKTTEV